MGCVDLIDETLSNKAQEECVIPTNSASQIPLLSAPPPHPKKCRLHWLSVLRPRTARLVRLLSNFCTFFKKREGD